MESVPSESRPLTVTISSNAGSLPIVASNDDFHWLEELLCKAVDDGLVSEDSDDVVVVGEFSHEVKSRKRKLEDNGSDDECLVLDGDPEKLASVRRNEGNVGGSESDDLLVLGETGQVACRDYPHSRQDCIKFPFDTTPHVEHCDLVCQILTIVMPMTRVEIGKIAEWTSSWVKVLARITSVMIVVLCGIWHLYSIKIYILGFLSS